MVFWWGLTNSWEKKRSESEVAQSCPTLCDHMDCRLLASSIHGMFLPRKLEQATISFSKGSSQPWDQTLVSLIAGRHFTIWATREDLLEKETATHSSTLAWRIPRMEEPSRLQSMGSQRVGHYWATSLSLSQLLYWGKEIGDWVLKMSSFSVIFSRPKKYHNLLKCLYIITPVLSWT